MKKIIIIGGIAGGATAATRLRRLDETAEIVILERGEYISVATCGLPYYIGGKIESKSALTVQTPENFRAHFRVDLRMQSEAVFIDRQAKAVTVKNLKTGETYSENYDYLILAPGAEPVRPGIAGMESGRVFTLRTIPDTYKIADFVQHNKPKSAVVCGGGPIGVEMAENLTRAGLSVTLVEFADQIIAPLDFDMACDVHRYIEKKGVRLLLSTAVKEIAEDENGLSVTLSEGNLRADMLIMSVGVRAESGLAKEAGLSLNERGGIIVNERMQTSDPSIYAVGDVVEVMEFVTGQRAMIALAGPAHKQGGVAAENICGISSAYSGIQGTAILKVFDMTVASTGVNEKTAKRLGLDYDKSFTYSASHAGYYPGATNMSIKVIYERGTGKILGAQIAGYEGVDKRCDVFATAIRAKMTAHDLTKLELCYAPPYSTVQDPVNTAGLVIENLVSGRAKSFHWHDVANLPKDGSVTLLDVRTTGEYAKGHIEGFINIPLGELRGRLDELDKGKKIYTTCLVGIRGYNAARILTQNGFDTYNLSGGYRLYKSVSG